MIKKIVYTLLLSLLCFDISNAQLRKDLEYSPSLSGTIIDPTVPSIDEQLLSTSLDGISLNRHSLSTSIAITDSDHPIHFQYEAVPIIPKHYKYDCTAGYDCMLGLNKNDNFPQVIGKLGVQYLIERILE